MKEDYFIPLRKSFIKEIKEFLNNPQEMEFDKTIKRETEEVKLWFTKSILHDLHKHNYELQLHNNNKSPGLKVKRPEQSRSHIQESHLINRDKQLSKDSIKKFIKGLETTKLFNSEWCNIYSLMRDGNELADKLENFQSNPETQKISDIISPYIQFVDSTSKCEKTGLLVNDIWRYFRHTWTTEYNSIPGRKTRLLIRDKAVPTHPVIGIAELCSSVAQQQHRDRLIGWHPDTIIQQLKNSRGRNKVKWFHNTYKRLMDIVYHEDLLKPELMIKSNALREKEALEPDVVEQLEELSRLLSDKGLSEPTPVIIKKLKTLSRIFRELHYAGKANENKNIAIPDSRKNSEDKSTDKYWKIEAQRDLFRSKRCEGLAALLSIRMLYLKAQSEYGKEMLSNNDFNTMLGNKSFIECMTKLGRQIKSEKMGINMMDISICGAVAPYNHLIGGKLVSMMIASPEVTKYLKDKYGEYPSEIASSIAARKIVRKPEIVFYCTTSLYGKSLNQYTRSSIDLKYVGGVPEKIDGNRISNLNYKKLASKTGGHGTYHISKKTTLWARECQERISTEEDVRTPTAHSIFGEGVNPHFRMIISVFNKLGYPGDEIMQHKTERVIYCVKLISNLFPYLFGLHKTARYFLPQTRLKYRSEKISDYWIERWLEKRITNKTVIARVREHTLAYPVTHGARVTLPELDDDDYGPLFY